MLYNYPARMRKEYSNRFVSLIVVVVGTKIAKSRVLGICACCNPNQSVDICMCYILLL